MLLILAGVAISLAVGENGIIARTITARNKTLYADAEERLEVEVTGSYDEKGRVNIELLNNNLMGNLEDKVEFKYSKEEKYKELTKTEKIEKIPVILRYKNAEVEVTEDAIS